MTRRDAHQWWVTLSSDAKRRLIENPDGPIPADLIAEVTGKGALIVGTWWPEVQGGPDEFYLAQREYIDLLKGVQSERAWVKAEEAYDREAERYFPVPATSGAASKEPFDRDAAERLDGLRVAAADARDAYGQHVAKYLQQP